MSTHTGPLRGGQAAKGRIMKMVTGILIPSLALLSLQPVYADRFGSGVNAFDIPFVTIDNPGNAADTTGSPNPVGSVGYSYRIGQFEVSEDAVRKANAQSALDGNPLNITLTDWSNDNSPATQVSWFEAARFVNYLNTSSGSTRAYKFDDAGTFQLWQPADAGYNPDNLFRNSQAKYFLPSVDEWYKAAYHDASSGAAGTYFDYPTGSNAAPTPVASGTAPNTVVVDRFVPAEVTLAGGASPYGTVGQGGNAWEWEETAFDLLNASASSSYDRGIRGAGFRSAYFTTNTMSSRRRDFFPLVANHDIGFRVASIPEPSSLLLGALASLGVLPRRKR